MKKYLILLALLAVIRAQAGEPNYAVLKGTIKNPISDSISVTYYADWTTVGTQVFGARVDKDGKFYLKFPVEDHFTQINIVHGQQGTELIVSPGYDLTVSIDAANFDSSLHYEGKGAPVANFMAKHMLEHGFLNQYDATAQGSCAKEPADFEAGLKALRDGELSFLQAHDKDKLPKDFVQYWENYSLYENYYYALMYPVFHEMMKQHSYQISNIPHEDYAVTDNIPGAFDDQLIDMQPYKMYLDNYFHTKLTAAGLKDSGGAYTLSDSTINLGYDKMPPQSAQYFLASNLKQHIKYDDIKRTRANYDRYKKQFPHSRYLPMLQSMLELKEKTLPGQPAMDFTINTIDGKTMKLSDLKGKVVYLDFWASWCGPCRAEMPSAKKVEEHYKDKDVVFLYVSIDADDAAWKNAIQKMGIEGTHMRDGEGGWNGKVAQLYGVQGIPSYFLIGKDGKFAASQLRPSSTDELESTIDKLLQ